VREEWFIRRAKLRPLKLVAELGQLGYNSGTKDNIPNKPEIRLHF
jgi:hypothetical protein